MSPHEPSLLDLLKLGAKAGAKAEAATPRGSPTEGRRRLRLHRLELENIFCYRHAELAFEDGITVIAGPNGSGKSSLLEAIFFALYGSRAGPTMGRSLAEVLREGSRRGHVQLEFAYEGRSYTVRVELRRQGGRVLSERERCWLRRGDGREWQGAEGVANEVQRLLQMDREDFTNCVYVRQGEIDRLIRAGDEERRGMIDRLLRLERLERYATRAKEGARRAVNRQLDLLEDRLANLREELKRLEEEDLAAEQRRIEQELARQQEALTEVERELEGWEEARARAQERLRGALEAEQRRRELEAQEVEKRERLAERERRVESLREELRGLSAQVEELRARLEEGLQAHGLAVEGLEGIAEPEEFRPLATAREAVARRLQELEERLQGERTRAIQLQAEEERLGRDLRELEARLAEAEEELREEQARVRGLEGRIASLEAEVAAHKRRVEGLEGGLAGALALGEGRLAQERAELQEELIQKRARRDQLQEELDRADELIKQGRCPTCGQPVTAATLADHLEHLRQELAEVEAQLPPLEKELEELTRWEEGLRELAQARERLQLEEARLAERQDERARLSERLTGLERRVEGTRERRRELERRLTAIREERRAQEGRLAGLEEALNAAKEELRILEGLLSQLGRWLRLRERLAQRREALKALLTSIDELRADLEGLEAQLAKLQEERRLLGKLEGQLRGVETKLQTLREEREELRGRREELLNRRGIIMSKRERERKLREEAERVAAQLEEMRRLRGEVEQLGNLYRAVKKELRQRNIAALNHYFNQFFRLMDSGESYSRAIITEDYTILIELKDGQRIEPTLMSGGERALINIALRCAIHEVLARAVRAFPLILDEPTIYLDRERVQRLQFLLEELGRRVGQVIVVSHEESLLESADHEYRTHKERDNTSTVRRIR